MSLTDRSREQMSKASRVKITYKLIFITDNPIEITIEADSPVECHIKAILHANVHYPDWHGIKEIKKHLLNDIIT